MKLLFEDKETKGDILSRAKLVSPINTSDDMSYLFYGDNFEIMSALLNGRKGFIDLIYIDPPFNTNQIFSVSENRANTISRKKGSTIAYSDLMTDDEFIKFMYERFVLIYELLSEEGSLYVHIDTKMGHYFKIILDEIFGTKNFKNDITRIKSNPKNFDRKAYGNEKDMILFYSKNSQKNIWNEIKISLEENELATKFTKIDADGRRYTTIPLHAPGETTNGITGMAWRGMLPPAGRHWRTSPEEFDSMDKLGLIEWSKTGNPRIKKYADEHKGKKIQDIWKYKDPQAPKYPTQKNLEMLELIIKQSSRENSIIMDCFAGSGTTLLAAAKLGRKFIGIDSSEIAINVIKNRLTENGITYK
ncbi:MAG: site-specific DNA-methyltransferase [Clostridiales bacterium]|nr:site-specific DNA-methyltransferase [Clostridiales bacterium]